MKALAEKFGVENIYLIKPGIGKQPGCFAPGALEGVY